MPDDQFDSTGKDVGEAGEEAAIKYLVGRGYKIIETNYRTRLGEIDVIAFHKGYVVFVEVKSRISRSLGPPLLSVTPKKVSHIIRSALFYLKGNYPKEPFWRIDIISVRLKADYKIESIEIIENAVEET